ncbi:MAG: fibronectin type III domain-containing protein [Candidatus Berkelbacteria bacterium]
MQISLKKVVKGLKTFALGVKKSVFAVKNNISAKPSAWQLRKKHLNLNVKAGSVTVGVILLLASFLLTTFYGGSPDKVMAATQTWNFSGDNSIYQADAGISTTSSKATLSTPGAATGATTNINPASGVSADGAAQFTAANKDYLTVPSNASLQTGDIDFEVGAWVYLDSNVSGMIISKGLAGSGEYGLWYSSVSQNFKFGGNTAVAIQTGTASLSTWYFVRGWHDATANTVNISVNNAATISLADVAITAGATAFVIGNQSDLALPLNGRIDSAYFKKSISTSGEATALYNSGNGRTYADLTSANGLDSFQTALTSWWGMNEESGTRYDAKGTNNLTPAGVQLINATTLNGGFETLGAGGADVFATWIETRAGLSTINAETSAPYSGTYAARFDFDAAAQGASLAQNGGLVTGKKYKVTFYGKASGTGVVIRVGDSNTGYSTVTLTTSYAQYTVYFTATNGNFYITGNSGYISKSVFLDNVTIESVGPLAAAGIAAGLSTDSNFAAQFNGTSNYLKRTSNASLQTGDIDFTLFGWVNMDNFFVGSNPGGIISKGNANGVGGEYMLRTATVAPFNRFQFYVRNAADSASQNVFTDVVSTSNWYFIVYGHDSVNNQIFISVNNGTPVTTATSAGVLSAANDFNIGSYANGAANSLPGRADGWGMIKRILTTDEKTALFNGGKGLKYAGLPTSISGDASLKGFWNLDTKSGTRLDQTANGNDLSDVGTVTQGYGVGYYDGAVSKITDLSGHSNTFTQTSQTLRPVYDVSGINSHPAFQFDGVDDTLGNSTDLIGTGDVTVTTVIKPRSSGGSSVGRIIDNSKFYICMSNVNSNAIQVSSDSSTGYAVTPISSIAFNTPYVVSVTRKADGKVNVYINGALSGTADQVSGPPTVGGPTYLGNKAAGDRAFDGWIGPVVIQKSILDNTSRNSVEKTLGAKYGITVAESSTPAASSSIYPTLSLKSPMTYSSLEGYSESLAGGSTGTLHYQLSNDSTVGSIASASYYYYNGAAWTLADKNNAYQTNTAAEVNANISTFPTITPAHNIKWRAFFVTDGIDNPALSSINMTYVSDTAAPNNPSVVTVVAKNALGGATTLTTDTWHNYATPSFSWTAPADNANQNELTSGLAGYLVYFGTDNTANIGLSSGLVAVGANNGSFIWQNTVGVSDTFTSSTTLVAGSTYYLKVVAVDNASNPAYHATSTDYNLFAYKYDNVAPATPLYVSVAPSGYSRTNNFTFTWPTTGQNAAVDTGGSGLQKYQYRIGNEVSWHDITGDATTNSVTLADVAAQGVNIFYLQAVDTAGNASSLPVRTNFYFNNLAPAAPANLRTTSANSSTNQFAFAWDASPGEIAGYYYSVNVVPSIDSANFASGTSLSTGSYATKQGENILYVVAKDNAGNYDFSGCSPSSVNYNANTDTCAAVAFSATTTAPGIPGAVQAYDISDRNTQNYAVAVKWNAPEDKGTGVFAGYNVYRSTDGVTFANIGPTDSRIFADAGSDVSPMISTQYYYYVVAKDSAGQSSAPSAVVSVTPTGRYTTPPVLVSAPKITVNPTSISVKWVTDRESSSFVQIKNGNTFVSEQGQVAQTTDHEVKVVGLKSQTDYTFNIRSTDVDGNSLLGPNQEFKTANTPSVYDLTVSNITQSSAIINFKSTSMANFTLKYGETSDFGENINEDSNSSTTNHSLAISNLKPGTTYFYRLVGGDSDGNELRSENSFATLPMPTISKFGIEPVKEAPTTTLKVAWETNVPTSGTVKYSTDGVNFKEQSISDLSLVHEIVVSDLADNQKYTVYSQGRDQFGNVAESTKTVFDTPNDSRPPRISDIVIESSNIGNTGNAKAQVAVSWKTDEPASSQVEFGIGLSGNEYTNKTSLDTTFTNHHLVIISDLDPGKPYHLRILSADMSANMSTSGDNTVISGDISRSALQIILNTMQNIFGWMGRWIK